MLRRKIIEKTLFINSDLIDLIDQGAYTFFSIPNHQVRIRFYNGQEDLFITGSQRLILKKLSSHHNLLKKETNADSFFSKITKLIKR